MSYDELLPWRALAQRIPKDVLNPTHRLIIVTLLTYESADKGAFFKPENIANELGLTYRSVMDNFHYLSVGLKWEAGKREPCVNPECKAHLGVLRTSHYARKNRAQTYRIDMGRLEELASMHSGAHSITSVHSDTEEYAPEYLEHAPRGNSGSTPPHAYKHNKHLINTDKRNKNRFLKLVSLLPTHLQGLQQGKNLDEPLDRLEAKGITLEAIALHLSSHNYAGSDNPYGLLVSLLEAFSYSQPDLIARGNRELEQARLLDEENAERERARATPEVASKYIKDIHELLKRPKE